MHVMFILLSSAIATVILGVQNEDRVVLSPMELINEVLEERQRTHDKDKCLRRALTLTRPTETESVATERDNEEAPLKRRKVWSRWGKWGKCSVTCGSGAVTRRRACEEGRCAPGEFEEQRRPCDRLPCDLPQDIAD